MSITPQAGIRFIVEVPINPRETEKFKVIAYSPEEAVEEIARSISSPIGRRKYPLLEGIVPTPDIWKVYVDDYQMRSIPVRVTFPNSNYPVHTCVQTYLPFVSNQEDLMIAKKHVLDLNLPHEEVYVQDFYEDDVWVS